MSHEMPYTTLATHYRSLYGTRAHKVPLDAGFSCPNRDGTLSRAGCAFCSPQGAGTGAYAAGVSLQDQWQQHATRIYDKYGDDTALIGYLQAYSNTHAPVAALIATYSQISRLPGIAGLSVGTRPDWGLVLDDLKLDVLASLPLGRKGLVWLELGLQTAHDATLSHIGRGHTVADFVTSVRAAHERGLRVVAHVMHGLPTPIGPPETGDQFLATIDLLNTLPIEGIKIHNTYVHAGTPLATAYHAGRYTPPDRQTFVADCAAGLACLRPDIVVHRINADPPPGTLMAPEWAADKNALINDIREQTSSAHSKKG